jgi:hypothetical protein
MTRNERRKRAFSFVSCHWSTFQLSLKGVKSYRFPRNEPKIVGLKSFLTLFFKGGELDGVKEKDARIRFGVSKG